MRKLIHIVTIFLVTFVVCSFVGNPVEIEVVQTGKTGVNIGDYAPNITLESPDGKTYSLSALKGKYVLIDFWASWCGPCRRENPNVVSAYKKYNKAKFKTGDGFEIFSVSLDNDISRWTSAIEQDNLSWKYHVSDLRGWSSSAASLYRVSAIPQSFLVDPNGVIIAQNLKGMNLHLTLDKYVKSL